MRKTLFTVLVVAVVCITSALDIHDVSTTGTPAGTTVQVEQTRCASEERNSRMTKKIPVILHTDLGTDIDDSWALIMLLRQDLWDLKMILVDTGDLRLRAAHVAGILKVFGKTNIPIGLGFPTDHPMTFKETLDGTELDDYSGGVFDDGPGKLIEIVEASEEPVTLISIGPAPALKAVLDRAPQIAKKIRFIGMFGSIWFQHDHTPGRCAEYNIVSDIPAAKALFAAPWLDAFITPLDSCGCIQLDGEIFQSIYQAEDPALRLLMAQNDAREKFRKRPVPPSASSILYDTVAIHLASTTKYLKMENMQMSVDDSGMLKEDPSAPVIHYAVGWTDLPGYQDFLLKTLLGKVGNSVQEE